MNRESIGTILVIDDEDIVREFFKDIIQSIGYKVVDFSDPVEAVKYYRENFRSIALVLFDMIMPGLNGKEVFFLLKKTSPDLRSIVCSGVEQDENISNILSAGCSAFLKKPVSFQSLEKTINSMLK